MIREFFARNRSAQAQRIEPVLDNAAIKNSDSSIGKMNPDEFAQFVYAGMNSSGMVVNEQTAMKVSAVYACVSLIGGAIASLPLPVYTTADDTRKKVKDSPLWWLLNQQPNDMYSAAVFWESMVGSLLLNGDGIAEIVRPSMRSANVAALQWYPRRNVQIIEDGKRLVYLMTDTDGTQKVRLSDDVLHIPGPGFDGKQGMSQIKYVLSNAAGTALAADEFSGQFFKNGARPDFVMEIPGKPDEKFVDLMRKSWAERHQGSGNSHAPALLHGGAKVHELTMNAEDTQLIATRQFQVEDIARIFGVPPHMIGHTASSTSWGTGIEQMSIGFGKFTLGRHLKKIEQELNRKLFGMNRKQFVEFNMAGLERGDYKTRIDGYRAALGRAGEPGFMTVNEVRRKENLPPVPGGNDLNMGTNNEPTA